MKLMKVTLFVAILFTISCINTTDGKLQFTEVAEYNLKSKYYTLYYLSHTEADGNQQLYFIDLQLKKSVVFDLISLKVSENPFKGKMMYNLSYLNFTGDTAYSFNREFNSFILKDNLGNFLSNYEIPLQYTPFPSPGFFLKIGSKEMIVGNTSKTISFETENSRKEYYMKVKPVFKIRIQDSMANFCTLGSFPKEYKNSGANYFDHMPKACFGKNDLICLSFGAHHKIYMYDDTTLIHEKEVKSKFIEEFKSYPDSKKYDMLFRKSYSIEEPRYTKLIYDPWYKFYYRLVKHRAHFDQQTNKKSDSNWSVIITDEEFNILDEIVFDYSFNPNVFIPTKEGVLLSQNNSTSDKNSVLKLFKIERND